ncbi:MAG: SH3 domain-containing protein [Anaerolineae bacterium]|nr:SH3 domain-containing protein [Anaerolineae bacterium]
MRILRTITLVSLLVMGVLSIAPASIVSTPQVLAQDCTFTVTEDTVILRSGPGREYAEVGRLYEGDTLSVVGRDVGIDLYVWWEGPNDVWVRSDLGDSDCGALCGDTVCEYGEDSSTCPEDCSGANVSTSGDDSCLVPDCQSCYESIDCYPDCNVCTCDANEYGCTTCYCDYSDSTSVSTATASGGGGVVTTYADISCTFTPDREINLRGGPGIDYAIVGEAFADQSLAIVARDVGADTYIWWKTSNDEWVRSDLGTSDCPNLCGDGVCEIDEDASSCAADCGTTTTVDSITSSTSCQVDTCEECYETVSCYPNCGNCTCENNENGCPTCYCTY